MGGHSIAQNGTMKAFRSKISNAAGRLKDTVERSVLSDDVGGGGGGGGPRSRRNSRSEGSGEALDEDNTFVRLPLEAARKIRCFSKGDVFVIMPPCSRTVRVVFVSVS